MVHGDVEIKKIRHVGKLYIAVKGIVGKRKVEEGRETGDGEGGGC